MLTKILSLTKQFISIPSIKENNKALHEVLDIAKGELSGFHIEEFEKDGIPSILVYKENKKLRNFKIILDAHLDVVPGNKEQYASVEKDGRLYARGAFDMKAAAAVELLVFKEVAQKVNYPLALQLVTDEEIGGFNGAKYQADEGVRAEFAIAGEGTDLKVKNEAKGVLWANLSIKGKTAHAAYLWQGSNAIRMMNQALNQLAKKFPEPQKPIWKTTLNLSTINSSNQTYNKVADDCTVGIDIRYIPKDTETIVSLLKKTLPSYVQLDIKVKEPAQFTSKNNVYLKKLQNAVKKSINKSASIIAGYGASDIRHFNRVGCDGVEFGPTGYGLHTDCEWVDINSLKEYYISLKRFLLDV